MLNEWLLFLVAIIISESKELSVGDVNEMIKLRQSLLASHSMMAVKLSASNCPPVMLSRRSSG